MNQETHNNSTEKWKLQESPHVSDERRHELVQYLVDLGVPEHRLYYIDNQNVKKIYDITMNVLSSEPPMQTIFINQLIVLFRDQTPLFLKENECINFFLNIGAPSTENT